MIVLLKWSGHDATAEDVRLKAVFSSEEELQARLERIQAANPQYQLRPIGTDTWKIGPDEDQGFFGDRPVWLRAFRT